MTGAAAAIVLGVATTAGLAAASGTFSHTGPLNFYSAGENCAVPTLAGAVVDVTVTDMGAMMGGPYGPGPAKGDRRWGPHMGMAGMMRLFATPDQVPHGTVSLRVLNTGALAHEVVVLPLAAGQSIGQRREGTDGEVDETGSLGEASNTCAAGTGKGIASGSSGWTTLSLRPGRYELVCNLPGHYTAGMYAEFDVTG